MQLRLFLDGTLTFVYQNFQQSVINSVASKKFPVLIGLKDGFSAPVPESTTGKLNIHNVCWVMEFPASVSKASKILIL